MTMKMSTPALPAPITATGSGAFSTTSRTGTFNMAMDFSSIPQVAAALGSSQLKIAEILDGSTIYMKLPAALDRSPQLRGKPWMKINLADAAKALGVSGISSLMSNPASSNPSQLLHYLRATSSNVTKVGSQTVDGFQTTHYKARIQLSRVPNGFPPAQRAQVRQAINSLEQLAHVQAIPVDVWIDHQNLVRQMAMSFSETVSGQTVSIAMTIDIPEYGPQPVPALPPASQVTNVTGASGSGSGI